MTEAVVPWACIACKRVHLRGGLMFERRSKAGRLYQTCVSCWISRFGTDAYDDALEKRALAQPAETT
jgi:hypothetical protein